MKYEIHATFHHDMIGNEMMGETRFPVGMRGFNTRAFPEIMDIENIFVWTSEDVNQSPQIRKFSKSQDT